MLLKAAFFEAEGFDPVSAITLADVASAKGKAGGFGILWAGNLHNLRAWAEVLVATRAATPGFSYPSPLFAGEIVWYAASVYRLWSEVLRYHKNVAYLFEVNQVRKATEWLLTNARSL